MTILIIINPKLKTIETLTGDIGPALAKEIIGNEGVDHGMLAREFGYIVYEWGMYDGLAGSYFAYGKALISGVAIVYAVNDYGETEDISAADADQIRERVRWFDSGDEVERAIKAGEVKRPRVSLTIPGQGTQVFWEWPSTERPRL
jgi:hypothetical protein